MLKIRCYSFSDQSGEEDIINLLNNLDNYLLLSTQEHLDITEMQNNFHIMIDNLLKCMSYMHINHNWSIEPELSTSEFYIVLNKKVKKLTGNLLIKSLLNTKYAHLIFMFHQYAPFTNSIEITYKLLINSIINCTPDTGIYIQQLLSIYLTDAAIYNNAYAINILINEYNVSPTIIWHTLCITYKDLNINNMPIIYTTNTQLSMKFTKFFIVSNKEQEHIFIMMLNKIDFSSELLLTWQIQEIFRCAFKNNFILAINYLLTQQDFCRKLYLKEEDIIMIAFSSATIPGYEQLINIIFNHPNMLHNNPDIENIILTIDQYKAKFNNLNQAQINRDNNDKILKIILNFINTFMLRNPEQNALYALLITTQNELEKLQAEQDIVTEYNQQLQTEVMLLKQQYNKLLYKNSLLHLQLHNIKHNCPILEQTYQQVYSNETSVDISSPTIPTINRRFSYYL